MNQSVVIVGTLVLAFILYITAKGELPQYLSVFVGQTQSVAPTPSSTGGTTGGSSSLVNNLSGGVLSAFGVGSTVTPATFPNEAGQVIPLDPAADNVDVIQQFEDF